MIDCRTISPSFHDKIESKCRTRIGDDGWESTPFQYEPKELNNGLLTVKTFPSWRNTKIPTDWKEIRDELDKCHNDSLGGPGIGKKNKGKEKENGRERKNSWWSTSPASPTSNNDASAQWIEDVWDENHPPRGCSIM